MDERTRRRLRDAELSVAGVVDRTPLRSLIDCGYAAHTLRSLPAEQRSTVLALMHKSLDMRGQVDANRVTDAERYEMLEALERVRFD